MEWRYIEDKDAAGDDLDEAGARAHFGVHDPGCPVLELEGGWFAVWFGAPQKSPTDYPQLSRAPKDPVLAKQYPHV